MSRIHKGDTVTIRPEWQDDGDADLHWVAMDDEEKGRVTIANVESMDMPIVPTQVVNVDMLEIAERWER